MFDVSILARITLVIGFILNTPAAAQDGSKRGFLDQGTTALNPVRGPDGEWKLFLYVPGYTLLYELDEAGKHENIGSGLRPKEPKKKYRHAITQDGIRVLVRDKDIKEGINDFGTDHFVVHRPMPLCKTEDSCGWEDFSESRDTLSRVHGKFEAFVGRDNGNSCTIPEGRLKVHNISVDKDLKEGFIPRRGEIGLKLDESGYITLLCHEYPDYSFNENLLEHKNSPCDYEHVETKELHNGRTEKITHGRKDEDLRVKSVEIGWRPYSSSEGYFPYGRMEVKKVRRCQGSDAKEMIHASFTMEIFPIFDWEFFPMNDKIPESHIIYLDKQWIKKYSPLSGRSDGGGGLVSINSNNSYDHFKLLDSLLKEYKVPKSIANFIIKEINVAKSVE